jgi:hypothetical protein
MCRAGKGPANMRNLSKTTVVPVECKGVFEVSKVIMAEEKQMFRLNLKEFLGGSPPAGRGHACAPCTPTFFKMEVLNRPANGNC